MQIQLILGLFLGYISHPAPLLDLRPPFLHILDLPLNLADIFIHKWVPAHGIHFIPRFCPQNPTPGAADWLPAHSVRPNTGIWLRALNKLLKTLRYNAAVAKLHKIANSYILKPLASPVASKQISISGFTNNCSRYGRRTCDYWLLNWFALSSPQAESTGKCILLTKLNLTICYTGCHLKQYYYKKLQFK